MTPEERAALDAMDPENVRLKLLHGGPGRTAEIPGFKVKSRSIARGDVEDWLAEKHVETVALERTRYRKILGWTVAAALAAAIAAWPVVEPWLHKATAH